MNNAQLAQLMSVKLSCNQVDANHLLNQIVQQIQAALCEGENIYLTNFGTFELRYRPAKDLFDDTKSQSDNLGHYKPSFKPSNSLKKAVMLLKPK